MEDASKTNSEAPGLKGLRLRTFISPVTRRGPDDSLGPVLTKTGERLCWMDQLFDGGILIPGGVLRGEEPPLLWLVTGPPGTGKTTFALELCHRLATELQNWPEVPEVARVFKPPDSESREDLGAREVRLYVPHFEKWRAGMGIPRDKVTEKHISEYLAGYGNATERHNRIRSLYVALESPFERIRENMERFGWDITGVKEPRPDLGEPPGDVPVANPTALMWILGSSEIEKICPRRPHDILRRIGDRWNDTWGRHQSGRNAWPGVVVIDSLNTLPRDAQVHQETIDEIRQGLRTRTWLVIVICAGGSDGAEPWEFLADIITRFGEDERKGYLLRTLRIVKAKNQFHAWGDHRLKIYPNPKLVQADLGSGRVSPYIPHGGMYVFPSVSRLLGSTWGGHGETTGEQVDEGRVPDAALPLEEMDTLVGRRAERRRGGQGGPGLPGGRCTAFIGPRGLMKSHLAYLWLLWHLRNDKSARGLLISLRDDRDAALATLRTISEYESDLGINVADLWRGGRLRIMHLWPGYIPPEEFMHNVVVRLDSPLRFCVVNGIDHLSARLPLCADLDIFVPALVSLLTSRGVTSVFAATEEVAGTLRQMGLLPMADLVLRFSTVEESRLTTLARDLRLPRGVEQIAGVTAERVPSGGVGGRHGYLFRNPETASVEFRVAHR